MRSPRRLVATGALSALALAGIPSAGAQTPTVTAVIGSADGLFVDLDIDVSTPPPVDFTFGPEPSVTLPPEGGSVSDEVLDVDESVVNVSLTADVLATSAAGGLGPQGFATAETTVADIALLFLETLGLLEAELISATCSADLSGVTGSTTLVGASVLETDISGEPEPNTELDLGIPDVASATVTLNRQVENPDGSLSVTALVVEVEGLAEGTVAGTVQIGPATCGVVEGLLPVEVPAEEVVPAEPVPAQVTFTG